MKAVDVYLKELKDVWGFSTEELLHIEKLMEEYAISMYWDGYLNKNLNSNIVFPKPIIPPNEDT